MEKIHLTIEEIVRLVNDFQADNYDGFVSSTRIWVENRYNKELTKPSDPQTPDHQ